MPNEIKILSPKLPLSFPDLPRNIYDFYHLSDLLADWLCWAGGEPPSKNEDIHFKNSAIHMLECTLIMWLAPYASLRGDDSEIFKESEFSKFCNSDVFADGYPLEMAQALHACYLLEKPWNLSEERAALYKDDLIRILKDIALYHLEESDFKLFKLSKYKNKLEAANDQQGEKLEKIHKGSEVRSDQVDKKNVIAIMKAMNITCANRTEVLKTFSHLKEVSMYSPDTVLRWYKEAMPGIELKGGRPKLIAK